MADRVIRSHSGVIIREEWGPQEALHREDDLALPLGPAAQNYYMNGALQAQFWYRHGQLHRDHDQPAEIAYHDDGSLMHYGWYQNGLLHREADLTLPLGPAVIIYDKNGAVVEQTWFRHNVEHRDADLPATIWYYPDGSLQCEVWFQKGKRHRETGPAEILYQPDGSTTCEFYFQGIFQWKTVIQPEPALEDLVKSAMFPCKIADSDAICVEE